MCTMWYITAAAENATPKARLLDAVVGYALAHGIADQSLRTIAEAVGTSHRMLIHHFGSRTARACIAARFACASASRAASAR